MVKNYKDNKEYDGRYVLFKKDVVYQLKDGDFVPTVSLSPRRMVDFSRLSTEALGKNTRTFI